MTYQQKAQIECQSHHLILKDAPTVEHIARYNDRFKQGSIQSNGKRPYGVSCLVGGIDCDDAHLFQTDPSGMFYMSVIWETLLKRIERLSFKLDNFYVKGASAIGRGKHAANEYLERHYRESLADVTGAMKLAQRSLLEVVHSNNTNFDVAVLKNLQPMFSLKPEEIALMVKEIKRVKENNTL